MPGCCESEEGRAAERRGAALLIAWWLFRGDSIDTVSERFNQRFGPIPPREFETLFDLAQRARDAGRSYGVLPSEQPIDPANVPITPGLPDEVWGGGRYRYDVEVQHPDSRTGRTGYKRHIFLAGHELSQEEITQAMWDWITETIGADNVDSVMGTAYDDLTINISNVIQVSRRY